MSTPHIDNRSPVIFCDFDGTITERDVIIMIMEAFAPPGWKDIVDQILNQRSLSIRDGVTQLFHLIPGTQREAIEAFVKEKVTLRAGFPEMLAFCKEHDIPFLVLSGGVDFFLNPVLAPYQESLSIYCNSATFSPDRIELSYPYLDEQCAPCGQCACCKIAQMNKFSPESHYRIAIGDSLTDLPMAKTADWTFARGQLVSYCQEENLPTTPYEDFFDIQTAIEAKLQLTERTQVHAP